MAGVAAGSPRAGRARLAVLCVIAAATAALYGSVVRLWWTNDDFYALHVLKGKSLAGAFLSPGVWRQSRMFTPLLLLSFELDRRAFGLRPGLFYLHQLVAMAAAAAAVYAVLRLWLPRAISLAAALLFLSGVPSIGWAQEILARHYAEGLVLAAIATRLFVLSLRGGRARLAHVSALLYLAAMLEKEVYVPLVALLMVLPEASARLRVRRLTWHALALALYLAARFAVLGTPVGGYGWTVLPGELPGVLAGLPGKTLSSFRGGAGWDALLGVALAAGVAAALVGGPRAIWLLLAGLALALAPAVPVSKAFQPRYAVLAWLAVVVAFAFGCRTLRERNGVPRRAGIGLAAIACVAAAAANRNAWTPRYSSAERMSAEGRFFMDMKSGDFLSHPGIPPAAMNELRWLKEEDLGFPRGAGWFADDLFLCEHVSEISRVYEYRGADRSVADATAGLPLERSRYCGSIREAAPLVADLSYAGGDFSWNLGPYPAGRYAIVYRDGIERFDVAPRGGYRHHASTFSLRIRYESPEGWLTFSPDIPLDFRASPRVRWERGKRREPGQSGAS